MQSSTPKALEVTDPYTSGAVVAYQGLYTGDNGSLSEFGTLFAFVHTKALVLRAQFAGFGTTPDSAKSTYEATTKEYDVMLNSALSSLAKS